MRTLTNLVAIAAFALGAGSAFGYGFTITGGGSNATFGGTASPVEPAIIAADQQFGRTALVPGAVTFDFTVTTGSDILLFDAEIAHTPGMNVPGGWYNETVGGTDTNPPNPIFFQFLPFLAVDTWVTTPGQTAAAGANTLNGPPGMRVVTHNDSTDQGPQTDFRFASITLIPDADGTASATLRGTLQTSASLTPIFDDFEATFFLYPGIDFFQDGVPSLSGTDNTVDAFFAANGADPNIVAADENSVYPNGVTMFVPTDAAIAAAGGTIDVEALLVSDDGVSTGLTDSLEPGWSLDDLTNLVPDAGDSFEVITIGGATRTISNGSVMFGGATIIASHQTDNGWIHVLDAVPVPEPSSAALLITSLIGLSLLRRRKTTQ